MVHGNATIAVMTYQNSSGFSPFRMLFLLFAACLSALLPTELVASSCPTATLVYASPYSQINASLDGTNKYGLEDGIVVRREDGGFTMISAEMWADPKWVQMRLGIWRSSDATNWTKVRTIRQSSGNYNGTDPHSSSWGPFVTFDPSNSTWLLSYVGYRGAPPNASGWLENFQGTIFASYASAAGDAGLDSDFNDAGDWAARDATLLAPDDFHVNGPWPHVCQGLQGTDSMYAFELASGGGWAALVGTSHEETTNPWPGGKWPVSLATAPALAGPWTRYNPSGGAPADAPCVNFNGGYTENPIVSRRPDNASAFHAVHDFIAQEGTGFGYACSDDGLDWQPSAMVHVPGGTRTPFGLVPMTDAEITTWAPAIVAYGILNASMVNAPNTSLQWAFFTAQRPTWEEFFATIVQLAW